MKKVESLVDDVEDVERREQQATVALSKLNAVWIKGRKLKTSTEIKLYKSHVTSIILLHNCGRWALTLTEEERCNACHRKQLKKILPITYPKKITNESLCRIGQEKPLSLQIPSSRCSIFDHILRRDKDIHAKRAYFNHNGNKLRERPKTTMLMVFNRDLALIQHPIRLHSSRDLAEITELAQNRKCWRGLASQTGKAA